MSRKIFSEAQESIRQAIIVADNSVAESRNREKFVTYTGEKLDADTDTAITQVAMALTNAAEEENSSTRDIEQNVRDGVKRAHKPRTGAERDEGTDARAFLRGHTDGGGSARWGIRGKV